MLLHKWIEENDYPNKLSSGRFKVDLKRWHVTAERVFN